MTKHVRLNTPAPDFSLRDFNGRMVRLSEFQGEKSVVLILNRGFTWPFCQAHLAQLRQDYQEFVNRQAEILVIGPEGARQFKKVWEMQKLPFLGLPDPKHTVLKRYGQEIKLFKLGRMPAQIIVDQQGCVRYVHYGHSMSDIPENEEILRLLDELNREDNLERKTFESWW